MERAAWTNERLDDLAEGMRSGFTRIEAAMRGGFARVDQDIREVRGSVERLQLTLIRIGAAMVLGIVGILAAILAGA